MNTVTLPRSVVEQALEALEHHVEQTRPIYKTTMAIEALIAALEQPQVEQEPVAWIEHEWSGSGLRHLHFERPAPTVRDEVVRPVWTPLYIHPQHKREPLTDEEIRDLFQNQKALPRLKKFIRVIEKAHGIGKQE